MMMLDQMRGRLAGAMLVALLPFAAVPAAAQTVTISPSTPDLGNVVSGATTDTVFRISASNGTVTRVSGTGSRVGTGTTRALVTIQCDVNPCKNNAVNVTIGSIGSPSGRAGALTNFTVAGGTAVLGTATGTNPISFSIAPTGGTGSRTFWVGADMPIRSNQSGAATGSATSGFYVYAAISPNSPTTGSTAGLAVANVLRPINVSVLSNLAFGRIVRPRSGSGTVTLDATTGARTVSGAGVTALSGGSPSRATYSVTGEGGQAFSLSYPSTFQMTGPGAPLTVTLVGTASGARTLSGAAGGAGDFNFGIGGSFPVSSTTAPGLYQGSYPVTVQYN